MVSVSGYGFGCVVVFGSSEGIVEEGCQRRAGGRSEISGAPFLGTGVKIRLPAGILNGAAVFPAVPCRRALTS